jgi:hypothetical protein
VRRPFDSSDATHVHVVAAAEVCPFCGGRLWRCQQRERFVRRLDGVYFLIRHDKTCFREGCEGHDYLFRPLEDLTFVPPAANFGLDVILEIGERHLRDGMSFARIGKSLRRRGVPISERHVGRLFRVYTQCWVLSRWGNASLPSDGRG